MKKCPACGKWTLEFDDYFGRFRCFEPSYGWMAASSAEQQIRRLGSCSQPKPIASAAISELGLTLTCSYDELSDALLFDFGLDEPAFDLPESDGRMIWKVSRQSGSVVGCAILGAKRYDVSQVGINFGARIECIEESLKMMPGSALMGRATRILIERAEVTARSSARTPRQPNRKITTAFKVGIRKFRKEYADSR